MFKENYDLENPPAKLTLTTYGETGTHEWEGSDISVEDVLSAVTGLLVGQTFNYDCVLRAMKEYAEEHLPEEEELNNYANYDEPHWVKTNTSSNK